MRITRRLVSIWNPGELRDGETSMPAANALLFMPDGYVAGDGGPAALFVHRWAGYHFDPTPIQVGETLAGHGIAFLSLGLRRRGGEGQIASAPADDVEDITLAMNFLANNGHTSVVLIGEGIGALSIGHYASTTQDPRVGGLAFLAPGHAMGWSLAKGIGQERFQQYLAAAEGAVKRGVGHQALIDVQRGARANTILQYAKSWLDWWGPAADTDLSRFVQTITKPIYVLGADEAWDRTLRASALASADVRTYPSKDIAAVSEQLIGWIGSLGGAPPRPHAQLEILPIKSADGVPLVGFLWEPATATDTAVLFVHDAEDIPGASLAEILAQTLAGTDVATLAPQLRRTGRGGHLVATFEKDEEDIAAYIGALTARGYRRVILCGHGFGCASVVTYQARGADPAVAGLVLLAPQTDGPAWAERVLGRDRYRDCAARAQAAVEAGDGERLLIDEPYWGPQGATAPGRFIQRAASWLACWGPGSANRLAEAAALRVPVLTIAGATSPDREALERIQPGGTLVLMDANHRYARQEHEVANRIASWLSALPRQG